MQWRGRRGSNNIEDRRSMGRTGGAGRLGGVGLIAVVVIGYFLGIDVTPLLNNSVAPQVQGDNITAADQQSAEFVSVVLADTEEVWGKIFAAQLDRPYTPATLVLFKDATASPCGDASGATGPFYCPGDKKVYLDTGFFDTLHQDLGAKGDFAMAYVVAHEVAHHVQDELGILSQANQLRSQSDEVTSNEISVRIELQADCLSGVWAKAAEQQIGSIEAGDFAEALDAAKRIGDDTLQRNAGQRPMPHTFTHGTSAQRAHWFEIGLQAQSLNACNTFNTNNL
jgi:predicted metalloprotease